MTTWCSTSGLRTGLSVGHAVPTRFCHYPRTRDHLSSGRSWDFWVWRTVTAADGGADRSMDFRGPATGETRGPRYLESRYLESRYLKVAIFGSDIWKRDIERRCNRATSSGNRLGVGRPAAQLVPRHGNFRLSRGRRQQPGFLGLAARGRGTRQQNRVVAAATELSGRAHGRQRLGNGARSRRQDNRRVNWRPVAGGRPYLSPARTCYDCHLVFAGIAARTSSLAAAAKGGRRWRGRCLSATGKSSPTLVQPAAAGHPADNPARLPSGIRYRQRLDQSFIGTDATSDSQFGDAGGFPAKKEN